MARAADVSALPDVLTDGRGNRRAFPHSSGQRCVRGTRSAPRIHRTCLREAGRGAGGPGGPFAHPRRHLVSGQPARARTERGRLTCSVVPHRRVRAGIWFCTQNCSVSHPKLLSHLLPGEESVSGMHRCQSRSRTEWRSYAASGLLRAESTGGGRGRTGGERPLDERGLESG